MDPEIETPEEPSGPRDASALCEVVPVEPGGTLFVDLDVGSVKVESHDEAVVAVDAEARGWAADLVTFSMERDGNDLWLEGHLDSWFSALLAGPCVRVRVKIPREYSVDVHTRGGPVRLSEIGGRVAAETKGGGVKLDRAIGPVLLRTAGGPIRVESVRGDVRARTAGGPIGARDIEGDIDARTSGGPIRAKRIGGRIAARTTGGPISASFTGRPEGRLETSAGGIRVLFPHGAGVDLDARCGAGHVRIDDALHVSGRRSRSSVVGAVNGGGAPLVVRSGVGPIRVAEIED